MLKDCKNTQSPQNWIYYIYCEFYSENMTCLEKYKKVWKSELMRIICVPHVLKNFMFIFTLLKAKKGRYP